MNINKIIVGGLYCKGYNGGDGALTGTYSSQTVSAVQQMASDIGLTGSAGTMFPKLFKALLTMDAYKRLAGGIDQLRSAQQWLNRTYYGHAPFYFIPTDGLGSRGVMTALIYGVQFEIGLSDTVANGNFGPATQTGLAAQGTVREGDSDSTKNFVKLFTTAMLANKQTVTFASTFTSSLTASVLKFQQFCQLNNNNGAGDFRTWASLLSSSGDLTRPATACDTATPLTAASAAALYSAGYRAVGRYLVTAGSDPTWKVLQPGELALIFAAGLHVFPIFQMTGNTLAYFTEARGLADGKAAAAAAQSFGFLPHTTIYFAVDYDAQDVEITSSILPYFRGVLAGLRSGTSQAYSAGVYGTRNTCSRVSAAFGLLHSFVSDMSTGFSGNLGFQLPVNWAIDQISTTTVSFTGGSIQVDRNVWFQSDVPQHFGGIDPGASSLYGPVDVNQPFFDWVSYVEAQAAAYRAQNPSAASVRDLTIQYLRAAGGKYRGGQWDIIAGGDDDGWIAFIENNMKSSGTKPVLAVSDPWTGQVITVDHMAYTMQSVVLYGLPTAPDPNRSDIGGWGGDLVSILKDYLADPQEFLTPRDYAAAMIGTSTRTSSFDLNDLLADVDALNLGLAMRSDASLSVLMAVSQAYESAGPTRTRNRFTEFYASRFGTPSGLAERGLQLFRFTGDLQLSAVREGILAPYLLGTISDNTIASLVAGFGDVLDRYR